MEEYIVCQNLTLFTKDVKAKNKEEAIKKARKSLDWEECEKTEDNIYYDALRVKEDKDN